MFVHYPMYDSILSNDPVPGDRNCEFGAVEVPASPFRYYGYRQRKKRMEDYGSKPIMMPLQIRHFSPIKIYSFGQRRPIETVNTMLGLHLDIPFMELWEGLRQLTTIKILKASDVNPYMRAKMILECPGREELIESCEQWARNRGLLVFKGARIRLEFEIPLAYSLYPNCEKMGFFARAVHQVKGLIARKGCDPDSDSESVKSTLAVHNNVFGAFTCRELPAKALKCLKFRWHDD